MKSILNSFAKISVFNIVFAVILTSCSSTSNTSSSKNSNSNTETSTKSEENAKKEAINSKVSSGEKVSNVMRIDSKDAKSSSKTELSRVSGNKK